MFDLWIPLYLPVILVVVIGGFWWSILNAHIQALEEELKECCDTVEAMRQWLAVGTGSTHSVAHWIKLADDAICTGDSSALCGGAAGGGGTNPPEDPPPF